MPSPSKPEVISLTDLCDYCDEYHEGYSGCPYYGDFRRTTDVEEEEDGPRSVRETRSEVVRMSEFPMYGNRFCGMPARLEITLDDGTLFYPDKPFMYPGDGTATLDNEDICRQVNEYIGATGTGRGGFQLVRIK